MKRSANFSALGAMMRLVAVAMLALAVSACSSSGFFGRVAEEEIIPAEQLYASAVANMDRNRYMTAIEDLERLERQHPYSAYNERAKVMITFANFRLGRYDEAALAADRFLALYPSSPEAPYIMFLKGSSYYQQITDITRDQELARDALETFQLLNASYPNSPYAAETRNMMIVAADQMAGKEISVGRYYLGNGQYTAAINRFREVVENHDTSTHVEEALYRLAEAYLRLGLVQEAQTAAAVLGHNYPSSEWYERAFTLLQRQGLSPQMNPGSWMAQRA